MQKNRYFKVTQGVPSETVIAQSLDASNSAGAVAGTSATSVNAVTIAASPTVGDTLIFNVDGYVYMYTVGAGETTAALAATAIDAVLNANGQGFTAAHTGTTTASFTLTAPVGTAFNGKTVVVTEGGNTFSAITAGNFSGGVNPIVAFQSNYKSFIATAVAGALAAYWDDTKAAVTFGTTTSSSNAGRKYFYAWKQADGTPKRTTAIPVPVASKTSVPYFAGQSDIYTFTLSGTISAGQTLGIRILDTTSTIIPYPSWEYYIISTGTIATDITAMRDKINAETIDKVFTATGSGAVLTVTFSDNNRTFKLLSNLETTRAQPTDATTQVIARTQKQKGPVGTYTDVKELENYFLVQQGSPLYTGQGDLNLQELGLPVTNVVTGTNYGIFIIKSARTEVGEVHSFNKNLYVIIALPTASLSTLAGL